MGSAAKKKIFISDIHMNDARSMAGEKPYGWFRKNIKHLENFLAELLKSAEVEKVVILGDLFDKWVIPADLDPIISFQEICNNSENKNIIVALQELAARDLLIYVPGNHDMSFSPADQITARQFMETCFLGVQCITDTSLPHGIYQSDTLAAEHGNLYTLFNSPDTWDDPGSFLPLGYFITRLMASLAVKTGIISDYADILKTYVYNFMNKPDFIKKLLMALAGNAGLKGTHRINMNGIHWPQDNTIIDIATYYEDLLNNWPLTERGNVPWEGAVFGDIEFLDLALYIVYFSRPESDKNVVLFGHTHKAKLYMTFRLQQALLLANINRSLPDWAIYANCGTWIDSGQSCTYVETEEDAKAKRLYVRLWEYYPKKKLRQEGFVTI